MSGSSERSGPAGSAESVGSAEQRTGAGRPSEEPSAAGRSVEGEIELRVSVERVWRALTEAEELERWFPLEARVEPGPEGRIWMSWGGEYGSWVEIQAWDPPHHLRTSWSFGAGAAQVTDYRLEGRGGVTHLRVVTSGMPSDASWDDLVEGTRLGWRFELAQLKHYLERHDGEARRAAYLRRRVPLPREEAWGRLMAGDGVDPETFATEVVDRSPPWQLAAVTRQPADGLIRLTIDPTHSDPDRRDVSVWLSAWGEAGRSLGPVTEEWSRRLDALFPEAEALEATSGT